ncbi:MAG TPA: energy-coupling factor transporter transmembrane protein EcfT [Firmicutes bacterium]|nr:energy-coupling factor transporter transmembrane protein EcfT [Bacillota bacterium]
MLEGITIGQYVPGESLVHRLDPRTKIVLSLVVIASLFLVNTAGGYGVIAGFLFVSVLLSGLRMSYVMKGLRPLVAILVITFALHLFMNPGREFFRVGPLVATYEGLYRGFLMVSRLVLLVVATSLLTLTTSPIQLTDGMEYLLRPLTAVGVPSHELAMMMTIALRFIPTLLEETEKIMKAQMARGADFETGNLLKRAKSLVPLLVPLFVSAFRRADELAMAMEARCYRGGRGRTRMRQLRMGGVDWAASLVTILLMGLAAVFL